LHERSDWNHWNVWNGWNLGGFHEHEFRLAETPNWTPIWMQLNHSRFAFRTPHTSGTIGTNGLMMEKKVMFFFAIQTPDFVLLV
jgi:hypothetical protein